DTVHRPFLDSPSPSQFILDQTRTEKETCVFGPSIHSSFLSFPLCGSCIKPKGAIQNTPNALLCLEARSSPSWTAFLELLDLGPLPLLYREASLGTEGRSFKTSVGLLERRGKERIGQQRD